MEHEMEAGGFYRVFDGDKRILPAPTLQTVTPEIMTLIGSLLYPRAPVT